MLDKIIAYKKAYVSENLSYKKLDLNEYLLKKTPAFICEFKPGSPSLKDKTSSFDLGKMINTYEPFANVISVLACEKFFHSSKDNIKKAKSLSSLPILFKDIIVSPLQIYEAKLYGADAILLMLSVLDDENFKACFNTANSLGLDVICEVHDEEEIARALRFKVAIIGINNRNFKDLSIDITTTKRLRSLIPPAIKVISESGFSTHQDILSVRPLVDGFLIGSSLMMAKRPDLKLRELIFGKVKICGLTRAEDAKMAYEAGSYYGGLNFSSSSKRFISLSKASEIIKAAPLLYGGVFVNESIHKILEYVKALELSFVQLHGQESQSFIASLRKELPNTCEIWQAYSIKDHVPKVFLKDIDMLVFDTLTPHGFGGSGECFSWDLLKDFFSKEKVMLAGGINQDNANEAQSLGFFGIDIASGAEDIIGIKSKDKMAAIFKALRG